MSSIVEKTVTSAGLTHKKIGFKMGTDNANRLAFISLLKPEAVKVVTSVTSKKRLLQEIGDLVQTAHGIHTGLVTEALIAREALGPTGVGHGVALPHARLNGIDHVMGAFVLLDKPIDFDAVDRQPVDIAFALFAPEEAGVDHLKALALGITHPAGRCSMHKTGGRNPDASTLFAILNESKACQSRLSARFPNWKTSSKTDVGFLHPSGCGPIAESKQQIITRIGRVRQPFDFDIINVG